MIALEDVTVRAGNFLLDGVSFGVAAGSYAVLMGKTGTGKTTLLEAVCGLRGVASGRIRVGGREVTSLPPGDRGIGYVPQDRALFWTMTVREHLAVRCLLAYPGVTAHVRRPQCQGRRPCPGVL